jgi:RNA polymerase sigma-70 factor (ECF subfamily)
MESKVSSINSAARAEPMKASPTSVCRRQRYKAPSFAELYSTYFRFVWCTARYLRVDASDLDDVVQDIFITICERLYTLERLESLRSWIYGIVRRVVSIYHRDRRAALSGTEAASQVTEMMSLQVTTPLQLLEEAEQTNQLWGLLDKLDASRREAFVLAELEGLTAPEIAAATNVPLNTVYSRLRVARQELEEALQRLRARAPHRGQVCPN